MIFWTLAQWMGGTCDISDRLWNQSCQYWFSGKIRISWKNIYPCMYSCRSHPEFGVLLLWVVSRIYYWVHYGAHFTLSTPWNSNSLVFTVNISFTTCLKGWEGWRNIKRRGGVPCGIKWKLWFIAILLNVSLQTPGVLSFLSLFLSSRKKLAKTLDKTRSLLKPCPES